MAATPVERTVFDLRCSRMSEPVTNRVLHAPDPADPVAIRESIGVVGRGRAGTALAAAFRRAGLEVDGPAGRGAVPRGEVVLLCVPDSEIRAAARSLTGAEGPRLVGHVSGATPLAALAEVQGPGAELFGFHPLQTLSAEEPAPLAGAACAVAGSTPRAAATAAALARRLGMRPFTIDDSQRASYHAAASIASNFLITLEAAAETVAGHAGFSGAEARAMLGPLVRQTVESWSELGPEAALTGPVARGDERTVATQRAAVAAAEPALVPLFDALVERTRALAESAGGAGACAPDAGIVREHAADAAPSPTAAAALRAVA